MTATLDRAVAFADHVATERREPLARKAADALYHVTSAALMATEGANLGAKGGDARRLLLARMVLDHRLSPNDPLAIPRDDSAMIDALLSDAPVGMDHATALLAP
jgi:hypothetical protein